MTTLLGPNTLAQWALPSYWDSGRLQQIQLASGETFEQLINDLTQGLALANASLLKSPLIASIVGITDQRVMEYGIGVSGGFEAHVEGSLPTPKRGSTTGHMLEPVAFDRATRWTSDFLRKARRAQIDEDVAQVVNDVRNLWEQQILQRFFKSTYTLVATAGRSVPFADAGTADASYIPVQEPARAAAFASSHTHYNRLDLITQANLETTAAHLWEHGIDAPYDLLVAQADMASWSNTTTMPGWIRRTDPFIRYGTQTDLANLDSDYVGMIETASYGAVRVRASARIPTLHYALYKSHGALDGRNPLLIRPSDDYGIGAVLLPRGGESRFPLENAYFAAEWEMGIGMSRVAATFVKSGGSYSTPTIS